MPLSLWGLGRLALARLATLRSGHVILTITNNGSGVPLVTTAAPHGLAGTEAIQLTGAGVYNGTADGASSEFTVTSATTFTLNTLAYSVNVSGGRWDII